MYTPAADDEITGLANYIDAQLDAIRAAAIGLTDAQARSRPTRSALSIAGLLKHVTYGMEGAIERMASGGGAAPRVLDEAAYARHEGSFALTDEESADAALAAFDAMRPKYLAAIRALDPAAPTTEAPQPWYGIFDERPANVRYYLVHQIEEMARHAGHADIIREQIDGMQVPAIVLSQDGMQESSFFQPYRPAAGTLGA